MAKSSSSLKDELAEFKRSRIVAAAAKLFYVHGYEGTTVDAIAAELETTKQFIYSYFDSKVDILFEVCQGGSERSVKAARDAARMDAPRVEQFKELIRSFTKVVCEEKISVAVFIREEKNLEPGQIAEIARRRREFDSIMLSILLEGEKEGVFAIDDAQTTPRFISGMVNFAFSWFKEDKQLSIEEFAERAATLALRMVAA
jgi:AcrR family transcriptional regulator